ncbi:MAG: periplasmic mercury ion-binding protein [Porticoccaceae bacterium]|nr:MAG: periplasmic mercury ion-binding protein [Porticoccaceae bacterium]
MNPKRKWLFGVAVALAVAPAWGALRTVTLSVPGMSCAACPLTVKKALSRVAGVVRVEVDSPKRRAQVTFDDAQVGPQRLLEALAGAGYPASLEGAP